MFLLLMARLMGQYCFARWHLSSYVTLPLGRPAGRFSGWAGRAATLHGGPVLLRVVMATPCYYHVVDRFSDYIELSSQCDQTVIDA